MHLVGRPNLDQKARVATIERVRQEACLDREHRMRYRQWGIQQGLNPHVPLRYGLEALARAARRFPFAEDIGPREVLTHPWETGPRDCEDLNLLAIGVTCYHLVSGFQRFASLYHPSVDDAVHVYLRVGDESGLSSWFVDVTPGVPPPAVRTEALHTPFDAIVWDPNPHAQHFV